MPLSKKDKLALNEKHSWDLNTMISTLQDRVDRMNNGMNMAETKIIYVENKDDIMSQKNQLEG